MPVKSVLRPNNNLTRLCFGIIIIFTYDGAGTPSFHAQKRCQTRSLAATRDSQPPARQGDRRTVRYQRLFRSQRLGTGQVRDASLRTRTANRSPTRQPLLVFRGLLSTRRSLHSNRTGWQVWCRANGDPSRPISSQKRFSLSSAKRGRTPLRWQPPNWRG